MEIEYYDFCIRRIKEKSWLSLWLWGCDRLCPGCGNTETMKQGERQIAAVTELEEMIADFTEGKEIAGYIITGGEPFRQPEALEELIDSIKKRGLYILLYSGHLLEELQNHFPTLLSKTDLLIDGSYEMNQKIRHPLYGSANQKLHFFNEDLFYMNRLKPEVVHSTTTFRGNTIRI